jgi:hypothetical protein
MHVKKGRMERRKESRANESAYFFRNGRKNIFPYMMKMKDLIS